MKKDFNTIFSILDLLPDLRDIGKLKLFHLEILKIIHVNKCIPIRNISYSPQFKSLSQAQRYRYVDELLKLKLIKYCNLHTHSKKAVALNER